MTLESLEALYLRLPEVRDIGDGSQDALLIRIGAGGYVGWGECEAAPLPTVAALVAPLSHSACHAVLDSVLGARVDGPDSIRRIHSAVKSSCQDLLQADHALSGIDVALWDLLGKREGAPTWSLLADENEPKVAYASLLFGESPAHTFEEARAVSATRYRAAKFGWGPIGKGPISIDREHLAAAREGLGPDRILLVDTGCAFDHDLTRAREWSSLLPEFKVYWWEEPFAAGAIAEYEELAKRTQTPLAAGESVHSADQARHLIDYAGVRFIQIDTGRIGGITAARQVALYARQRGIAYVNHTFTSNLALSASLQAYSDAVDCFAEVPVASSELARAIAGEPWELDREGQICAPEAPGLGVVPDEHAIGPYVQDLEIKLNGNRIWPKAFSPPS